MHVRLLLFLLLLLPQYALAQSRQCTFTWSQVTTNADGSAITDLAGYQLYMRASSSASYPQTPTKQMPLSTLTTPAQPSTTAPCATGQLWVVRAYDTTMNVSDNSNEIVVAAPPDTVPPAAPTNFRSQ